MPVIRHLQKTYVNRLLQIGTPWISGCHGTALRMPCNSLWHPGFQYPGGAPHDGHRFSSSLTAAFSGPIFSISFSAESACSASSRLLVAWYSANSAFSVWRDISISRSVVVILVLSVYLQTHAVIVHAFRN